MESFSSLMYEERSMMIFLSSENESIVFRWNENVFHAWLFHLIDPAVGVFKGDLLLVNHFQDPVGRLVGLPDDAFVARLAEAAVETGGNELAGAWGD